MSQLEQLMHQHTGYAFSSQFCLAGGEWSSIFSFFNYYDQVFPNGNISVRLLMVFHDFAGREIKVHEQTVAPGVAVQVNTRELGVEQSGIMAVAAIANADLNNLAAGKFAINQKIPAGFYVTWDRAGTHRDTMHEWESVANTLPTSTLHHVGIQHSNTSETQGLVLMNPNLAVTQPGTDMLTLRIAKTGKLIGKVALDRLPPMGSRMVEYSELFPEFHAHLEQHGQLVASLSTTQQAGPLTLQMRNSGEFHIHHL